MDFDQQKAGKFVNFDQEQFEKVEFVIDLLIEQVDLIRNLDQN